MMKLQPADYACIAGVTAIITYDVLAKPGQTISEACDRYLIANRLLTEAALAMVYLHVSNKIPPRYDLIHLGFGALKKARIGVPR